MPIPQLSNQDLALLRQYDTPTICNVIELFDVVKDPHEMRNIYDDPKMAGVVKKLKFELERLQL